MKKAVQKQAYTFLSTAWGMALCLFGIFWIINSLLAILHTLIQANPSSSLSSSPSSSPFCDSSSSSDNIAGVSFQRDLCHGAIDVVYTWVNGSDSRLQSSLAFYKEQHERELLLKGSNPSIHTNTNVSNSHDNNNNDHNRNNSSVENGADNMSSNRYRDNEELRYSLRSLIKFAPWVRNIWIVTNGQVPNWLWVGHPRLKIISHSQIFPNKSHLPVFSSPAIESHIHRIPGLADKFIYFNDDVMIGNHIWPDDFITRSRGQKVFLAWNVPNCAPGCPDTWVGDKYCDSACNKPECEYDGGDCKNHTDSRYNSWEGSRGSGSGSGSGGGSGSYSSSQRYCASGCPNNWVGDKVCDRSCKNAECAFDGGDCGLELIQENLNGFQLTRSNIQFQAPHSAIALYVNLSNVFPPGSNMLAASHDNPNLVRSAIVTQHLHILTLIFYAENDINDPTDPPIQTTTAPPPAHSGSSSPPSSDGEDSNANSQTVPSSNSASEDSSITDDVTPTSHDRVVEIFLQAEINGLMSNITFYISRPKAPPASPSSPSPNDLDEENDQATPSASISSNNDDETSTRRRLLSTESHYNNQGFLNKVSNLLSGFLSSSNEITENNAERRFNNNIPTTQRNRGPFAYPDISNDLMWRDPHERFVPDLMVSSARGWHAMNVEVLGVPVSDTRDAGIVLRDPTPLLQKLSVRRAVHLFPQLAKNNFNGISNAGRSAEGDIIDNGMDSIADRVLESYGWTSADINLANLITIAKKKELWLMEREWAGAQYQIAKQEAIQKSAHSDKKEKNIVWPWELGVPRPDLYETWEELISEKLESHNENQHKHEQIKQVQFNVDGDVDWEDDTDDELNKHVFTPSAPPLNGAGLLFSSPQSHGIPHVIQSVTGSSEFSTSSKNNHDDTSDLAGPKRHLMSVPDNVGINHGPRRKLLDTYGDSLRFVNNLYSRSFGRETRKAPAHMPHFIDKNIMNELQSRWPQQFDETSSHRFRHSHDMQYAFAYFYYLMSAPTTFDPEKVWNEEIDLNNDGYLDELEIKHLLLLVNGPKKASTRDLINLERRLLNASLTVGIDPAGAVNYEVFIADTVTLDLLEKKIVSRKKYHHELNNLDEVEFFMVPNNYSKVASRLDEIRAKMPKFICLNDDMNKTHDPPADTLGALRDFYISYFPNPSPFELPPGVYNPPNMYIDELYEYYGYGPDGNPFSFWGFFSYFNFLILASIILLFLCVYTLAPPFLIRSLQKIIQSDTQHRVNSGGHISSIV